MKETPILFGPNASLVGIVCEPIVTSDIAGQTFNAGGIPRLGPHRFNVKLSRALADEGVTSMRFDLSGLGDSRPASTQCDFLQQAVVDVRSAIDYLELHHGVRRFILIGNCSGAVHAYWTALADQRVAGILMFDGFWYRTRWSRLVRHWKRFRAGTWKSAATAIARRLVGSWSLIRHEGGSESANIFSSDESTANPPRAEYCHAIQTLVDRGVAIFLIFSGGVIDAYSYARQFRDGFADEPFVDKVRCNFLPEIDHTLLSLRSQNRLIDVIRNWILGIVESHGMPAIRTATDPAKVAPT
jgi:hypothetical protein